MWYREELSCSSRSDANAATSPAAVAEDEVVAIMLAHTPRSSRVRADTETADDIRNWIELVPGMSSGNTSSP